jgi:hypothetical protein
MEEAAAAHRRVDRQAVWAWTAESEDLQTLQLDAPTWGVAMHRIDRMRDLNRIGTCPHGQRESKSSRQRSTQASNLAGDLHVNANDLRAGYRAALTTNPNLSFGNYVAAARLGRNLGGRNGNITRDAILAGLANGDSLGRTLQNLGLSKDQAKAEIKRADQQIKESKRRTNFVN